MSKSNCLCGIHLKTASIIIAIVNIFVQIFNIFVEASEFFPDTVHFELFPRTSGNTRGNTSYEKAFSMFVYYYDLFLFSTLPTIGILCSILLIFGILKRNPECYVGFLVFGLIDSFLSIVFTILSFMSGLLIIVNPSKMNVPIKDRFEVGFSFLTFSAFGLLSYLAELYFFLFTINRARLRLIRELEKEQQDRLNETV